MRYYIKISSQQTSFLLPLTLVDKIIDFSSLEDQELIFLSDLFDSSLKSGQYVILIKNQNVALIVDWIEDIIQLNHQHIQPINHILLNKRLSFIQGMITLEKDYFVFIEEIIDYIRGR